MKVCNQVRLSLQGSGNLCTGLYRNLKPVFLVYSLKKGLLRPFLKAIHKVYYHKGLYDIQTTFILEHAIG